MAVRALLPGHSVTSIWLFFSGDSMWEFHYCNTKTLSTLNKKHSSLSPRLLPRLWRETNSWLPSLRILCASWSLLARAAMLATASPDDPLKPFSHGASSRRTEPIEMGKVFVGGLSRETTTDGLRVYFERFGNISDCVVMKDRSTGAPRGFGFVTYASQMVADRVVHHRHVIDGKEVEAKPAVPRDSDALTFIRPASLGSGSMLSPLHLQPHLVAASVTNVEQVSASNKIFVGGLSHETSETDFVDYFGAPPALLKRLHTDRPTPAQRRAHCVCPALMRSCVWSMPRCTHSQVLSGKLWTASLCVTRTLASLAGSASSLTTLRVQ